MSAPAGRTLSPVALYVLLSGSLLSMIDGSVVNVAIPDISRELHAPLGTVQWTVSGYLLALAAALPATSYLAKRFGTIRAYGVSLGAFTVASLACALAGTAGQLIAFRAVQGLAAAPLVPLSMNLLFGQAGVGQRRFPIAAGIALFLGPALGPSVGGLLVTAWGWPAIFLVNAPLGAAALLAMPRLRRAGFTDQADPRAPFDAPGLVLLSAGLVLALYGANEGPAHGWWSARSGPFWSAGLLLLTGYGLWAHRRAYPAVELRLLRRVQPALAVLLCTLTSVAMYGVLFLIPVLVQEIQRHGALASGLVLLPQGIVMGLSTKLGGWLGDRGWRRAGILGGLAAVGATTGLLFLTTVHTPLWILTAVMAARGLGIGLVIQPLLTPMLAGQPAAQLADANTLFNVGQRLGGSVGVSLLATYFGQRLAAGLAAGRAGGAALSAFHDTVVVAAGVAVLGLVCALFLRDRPAEAPVESAVGAAALTPGR
ncbi:MAG TPA: DHA2 family efflux MFS transporter permease subunit [Rugosimonospora sp.]|nr:DHA2 family efflux MFS transporter permease subunit [Rugosimonospora sp.]